MPRICARTPAKKVVRTQNTAVLCTDSDYIRSLSLLCELLVSVVADLGEFLGLGKQFSGGLGIELGKG